MTKGSSTLPRVVAAELQRGEEKDGVAFRARTGHVHRTWAGTFWSLPELYIQPESVCEVEKAVVLAQRCGRRIVTTGCGHSPSALTCTSSWMVNLDRLNRLLSVDVTRGLVVVQSGMRLFALCEQLDDYGLAMGNLGSINEQSVAGAIATGTHGSSLQHGLLSEQVTGLRITLASGQTVACSGEQRAELFRGALLSLGALGIVTEVTLRVVPAFWLQWRQTIEADARLLGGKGEDSEGKGEKEGEEEGEEEEESVWTRSQFVRAWWFPYTRRAVIWQADVAAAAESAREPRRSYYDGALGYYLYQNLLLVAQAVPRILPWVEWFVFGMQYGFANGSSSSGLQPSGRALLMNCLYSQFVNEWAIPLHRGPEALRRLACWLNRLQPGDADYVPHGIPFSADGLYVHAPVEVRVADTSPTTGAGTRPLLDPTCSHGPSLYLNATLYRPYNCDPPCRTRYYQAFEWLMRDLGGRPHWAKNFEAARHDIEAMYGARLDDFRRIRHQVDPDGMFVGPWHRAVIMPDAPKLPLEEAETARRPALWGGLTIQGKV
ncbi:hypothetical protein CDD81_5117 [Ophiocordyceps australis]|uniref:D-arabinono-1,4-lactone oxidase n=1 Tax=Ophiocordyceps australis TaxID=1399860 RepID=A0A2C5Y9T6_9HYPO|nr:hypothetical protein CDD81_5117 [Ophiocordyceps australis]